MERIGEEAGMIWEKVVTRELPLLIVFYANKGYYYLKKIDGFSSLSGFVENKNGLIERYVEVDEFDSFKKKIATVINNKKGNEIITEAMKLNKGLDEFITNFNKRYLGLTNNELLDIFLQFDKNYSSYWAYYLFLFFIGAAVEGNNNKKILDKYRTEITIFRGKHSSRVKGEEIFLPKLLSKIAQQTKISPVLLWYVFPKEIIAFLKDGKTIDINVLKERKKHYEWLMKKEDENYYFGKDADLKKYLTIKNDFKMLDTKEIKGYAASPGIVKGYVKCIMTIKDLIKVHKGDVIVAPMTDLNYMTAMKNAAAFVTDEGGITCHAAIVAREMRKPCIIGTKIATTVLKDGDIVEVNADNGTVTLVKKL